MNLFVKNSNLIFPFDEYPEWALDLDLYISDLIGDLTDDDYDSEDLEVKKTIKILEKIRLHLEKEIIGE